MLPPMVVVHDRRQAAAVLAAAAALGVEVQLRSARDASAYAGVGYLKALCDALDHELLIDCHDDAGLVMAALRAGCRRIAFAGEAGSHRRLADMAAQQEALVIHEISPPAVLRIDPDAGEAEAAQAFCTWISKARSAPPPPPR